MREICLAFIAFTLLSSCERTPTVPKVDPQQPAAAAKPIEPSIPVEISKPLSAPIAPRHPPTPPIIPLYPPLATSTTPTQPVKYLPNCPGMNTRNRRVVGSNCFGILPAVCGADKAASYIGLSAVAKVRQAVTRLVGHENIRWTPPGQAEIENFLPERLNMLLDDSGLIQKVDCY